MVSYVSAMLWKSFANVAGKVFCMRICLFCPLLPL